MKKVLSILILLASGVTSAGQQVVSTGVGYNLNEARTDAIEKSLMKACKSAVVSDKTFRDYKTERSNVIIYNGCLVKNYTVQSEIADGDFTRVTIEAEVIQNRLPGRILNDYSDWFFYDFNQHNDRVAQLNVKMKNAKGLIDEIFYDFPKNAFTIAHTPYNITYEGTQSYLNVAFNVSWNRNFLNALEDMFDILKDKSGTIWQSNGYTIKINQKYVFNNFALPNQVRYHLANSRPVVRVRVLDDYNREYVNACYQLRNWFNLYDTLQDNIIIFNTKGSVQDTIKLALPYNLPDNAKLQLDVVSNSWDFCKAFF